jgi:DNA-binding transcriptional ArsR family regulator
MDHDLLDPLKALADPNRLRIAGACGSGSRTVSQLAAELDLPEPAVRRHLDRLVAAGLVEPGPDRTFVLRVAAIHALGRRLAAIEPSGPPASTMTRPDGSEVPPDEVKIIRGFLKDDRLTTIPSQEKKRLVIIRYLRDRCFTEDRPYPEKEVNQRLALFHPDVATLRRAMVDEGLLVRDAGIYRLPLPAA